ncbi:fMet-Leu-Phe receptor [Biomphalaria glabrata]|nr:fMet-Leu-Phe receptor-like [Biomphalaria glabrata]
MASSQIVSWFGNVSAENVPKSSDDVLTFHQFVMFEGILSGARAVISVLGIFGNTINIMTFISMGIKDGFSLSMTLLAGIELFHVLIIFLRSVAYGLFIVEYSTQFFTWFPVEPFGLYLYFGHVARLLYTMVVLTTTFLSFARCMCVSTPLQFRHMFTTSRSILVLSFVTIISVGSYVPLLMTMTLSSLFDPRVNSTRLSFWVSPGREQVRVITGIVRNTSLPLSSQVVIVCCVLHMSQKLKTSVNFRLGLQSLSPFPKASVLTIHSQSNSFASEQASDKAKLKSLSGKERRAIQQMVFMSIVVIICDMPEILISLISVSVQTFGFRKPLNNFYLTVIGVNYTFQVINTSINIAIYWKYSSRYRENCCLTRLPLLDLSPS